MLLDSGPPMATSEADGKRLVAERYLLEQRMGRGGMGVVYRARDERTGKIVALKRMLVERAPANAITLFEQEFHALSELAHPCIVSVFDYGKDELGPFYTMELLDGSDLVECGRLEWPRACAVLRDVASALGLLHSRRLLHGDLSTRNVRLTPEGNAKLIDFGTLTPMGAPKMVAGTPPFLPPETLHGEMLDGRTDLYSLGAIAYRLLTGAHAYPARQLRELLESWRRSPRPIRSYAPDVPAALDDLVMELLRMDRMARPASAAAVVERLCGIAGLPRDERDEARAAYLAMPALVGRAAAIAAVRSALHGGDGGGTLSIEGEAGTGRSRLLDACVLEATLQGRTVLRAGGARALPEEYGLVRALASNLFREQPDVAQRAGRPWRDALGHVAVAFERPAGQAPPERRQLQTALREWLLAVSRQKPLLIAVDDIDRADEPSVALLAQLSHHTARRELSILVSTLPRPTGAAARLVQSAGLRLVLAPLSEDETETLLRSVFGQTENVTIVARRLHDLAAGNPRAILEIAQQLVDRGIARYEAGGWVLPRRIDGDVLHREGGRERIRALSEVGRELAQVLSLTDPLTVAATDYPSLIGGDPAQAYRAVLELLSSGLLVPAGDRYRLSHLGEAAAAELDPAVTREYHLRLARLREGQKDVFGLASHLLAAGDVRRAVETVRANRRSKAFSRPEAIELLERVVEECDALGVPRSERLVLAGALVGTAALFGDHERFHRHAPGVLAALRRDSGLDDWEELARAGVPEGERLPIAMERAQERHEATPEAERGLSGQQAFMLLAKVSSHYSSMATVSMDATLLAGLPSFLPFAVLSPAISVLDESLRAAREFMVCRNTRARALAMSVIERLRTPGGAGMPEATAASLRYGMLYMVGAMDAFDGLPDAVSHVVEFEDVPRHRSNAWRVRRVAHLMLGDFDSAAACHRRAELLELLDGHEEAFSGTVVRLEAAAQWMVGNLDGLKEVIERIAELARRFPGWQSTLGVARSHQRRLQGDPEGALEEILPAVERSAPGADPDWCWVAAAHVSALTALGRHHEAAELGLAHVATAIREDLVPPNRSLVRPVAEALVEAGRAQEALTLATAHVEELEAAGVRGLWLALGYEARALSHAALLDHEAFRRDATRCLEEYRRGKSSTLIANYEKLLREAARFLGGAADSAPPPPRPRRAEDAATRREAARSESFLSRLSICCSREERARYLLAILMDHAGADSGHVLLVRAGRLEHAASNPENEELPPDVMDRLEACLREQLVLETQTSVVGSDEAASRPPSAFHVVSLVAIRGGHTVIAGLAALRCPAGVAALDGALLETIAASLIEHEDAEPMVCVG